MGFKRESSKVGSSLVETMIGVSVMAIVITNGLVALGQAILLSQKSRDQAGVDHYLRMEMEELRSLSWNSLETLKEVIVSYENANAGDRYPNLQTLSASTLAAENLSAEVAAASMSGSTQLGKLIFHVTLLWNDKTGKAHEETRVTVITEGGISAGN